MHTIRVRDFNTQLHKWTEYPGNTNLKWHIKWHRSDLNVYRTFHLKASKCALFPSTHGTFSRIDHILGHKSHLDKNSPGCGLSTLLSWNPPQKKGHIWQTHRKHHSQWWKFESISSKIRNKAKMSTVNHFFSPFLFNIVLNKEVKLSLFADYIILKIENPKKPPENFYRLPVNLVKLQDSNKFKFLSLLLHLLWWSMISIFDINFISCWHFLAINYF